MNEIVRKERAIVAHGVEARAFNVVAESETGRIRNQKIGASRVYRAKGHSYTMNVTLRFDDELNNGHETFSATADIREDGREYMGGCCHEEIVKHFPEWEHLIKWHLVSTDGPMHYPANTLYHAGNRDHWGKLKGEPHQWDKHVRFGDSPITHKLGEKFAAFLKSKLEGDRVFNIVAVEHKDDAKSRTSYKFGPKYTFEGYVGQWYECPFDSLDKAQEWQSALVSCKVEFLSVASAWGEGKARELDHARSSAVWPEATDEQLCQDREQLKNALLERLPALLERFRHDMEAVGFIWPARK